MVQLYDSDSNVPTAHDNIGNLILQGEFSLLHLGFLPFPIRTDPSTGNAFAATAPHAFLSSAPKY